MSVRRRPAFLALTFALAVAPIGATVPRAHAARPMITDDARVVDEKACQLESWVRRNRDTTEYSLPACSHFALAAAADAQARAAGTIRGLPIPACALVDPSQPSRWQQR
jgi:hypothetical protein